MTIKAKVMDEKTYYLYAKCMVASASSLEMVWDLDPTRHQDVIASKGASNEIQLLEVDDVLPDDVEFHNDWLDVNATVAGQNNGVDFYEYSVSLDVARRYTWYMAELKAERDDCLLKCDWYVLRHRDQVDNSETTDLDSDEYISLLNYRKTLRNWPISESDVYARTAPIKPEWM